MDMSRSRMESRVSKLEENVKDVKQDITITVTETKDMMRLLLSKIDGRERR